MTGKHPNTSAIGRYVAGTMPLADIENIEEHLLICLRCRLEAEEALDFKIAVRSALAEVVACATLAISA